MRIPVLPLSVSSFSTSSAPPSSGSLSAHFNCLVRSWNAVIADLSRSGDSSEAFSSIRRLLVTPNRSSFPCALKACGALAAVRPGRQLHLQALRLGLAPDLFDMYSKCHELGDARRVFDETPERNPVVWTSMIAGCVAAREVVLLFNEFLADEGAVSVDSAAAVSVLAACSRVSEKRVAAAVHGLTVKMGLDMEVSFGNTLLDAYAKGGDLEVSRKVFDGISDRDVVSWNSMIALCAQNGLSGEALELYSEMARDGAVRRNAVTLSAVLLVRAHVGALQTGKCIHNQVIRMGLQENVYVGTSVFDIVGSSVNLKGG